MGWGDNNVYYNPEKFGLEPIGELNDPEACWSYDDLTVWKHEDGRVFWATDSGCSCPTPFEDYNSLDDLNEVTAANWAEFQEAVEDHCNYTKRDYRPAEKDELAADRTELLAKVSALVPRS